MTARMTAEAAHHAVDEAKASGRLHLGIHEVLDALEQEDLGEMVLVVEEGYRFPNTMLDGYVPGAEPAQVETSADEDLVDGAVQRVEQRHGRVVSAPVGSLAVAGVALLPAWALDGSTESL